MGAVWHGAVYGVTTDGPVILDARTGKDREVRPGAVPFEVDQYGGLTVSEGTISFVTATK
ncbi:hypothetical protein [Streptomyces sp. NPDC059909]|uniref:hypothetical protein n=1 Tax=Streptomyces sp. NPDC059909 TaxID=3346998 RepID=UPI00366818FA